jgi:catechol 2,3-dioxygenase-like lactoylglutathione lyase family enzyme
VTEPIRDLAHLSHVELLTPKPDASLHYFREILGMEIASERGDSVYLRCFGDYERSSLKLTASEAAGVGHLAYRTHSVEALERRVAALEAAGVLGLKLLRSVFMKGIAAAAIESLDAARAAGVESACAPTSPR